MNIKSDHSLLVALFLRVHHLERCLTCCFEFEVGVKAMLTQFAAGTVSATIACYAIVARQSFVAHQVQHTQLVT